MTPKRRRPARAPTGCLRAAVERLTLLTVSCLLFAIVGEVVLRWVPVLLPKATYFGSGIYDRQLGFYVPASTVTYNKDRFLRRTPNRDGFMDVDHAPRAAPGVTRVGFFGDSYVESVQVPLEEVFFRRVPDRASHPIETFGFGISGIGTLQSLLLYRHYGDRYDLDVVVYVFVPNDLGDHFAAIQRGRRGTLTPRITADLSEKPPGFVVEPPPPPEALSPTRRLAMALKSHSMLARVVLSRSQLLLMRTDRRLDYGTGASVPSIRDPALLEQAKVLLERILATWQREVDTAGRRLIVVYTPQGTQELRGDLPYAHTWHPWLDALCERLDLPMVDPTPALRQRLEAGDAVYGDHWTPAGHQVMAQVIAEAVDHQLEADSDTEPP